VLRADGKLPWRRDHIPPGILVNVSHHVVSVSCFGIKARNGIKIGTDCFVSGPEK